MILTQKDIERISSAIRHHSDYDFDNYSIRSFTRRIDKSLFDFRLDVDGLVNRIEKEPDFVPKLVNNITVNTTEMFRDIEVWYALKYKILKSLSNNGRINIWHAGCSTGQEVYSMLILLNEMGLKEKANIYATDLNNEVLDFAVKGEYSYKYSPTYFDNFEAVIRKNPSSKEYYNDVPYSRYFEVNKIRQTIRINESLRKKPIWKQHDLVNDDYIFDTKFDLILCRNVLIYFNISLQFDVIDKFYQSMYNNSVLVLGSHESIMGPIANNYEKKGLFYIRK